jgi:VWFA-related protein
MVGLSKFLCAGAFLLLLTSLCPRQCFAQAQTGNSSCDTSAKQQADQPQQSKDQIRAKVNEVVVPVTATDATGELVFDLTQNDFHIFDHGVEQKIDHWDLGGDPLAVALLIETSSRVRAIAPAIHSMSSIFTETVMAFSGEAAVITYDSGVEVHQTFTQDHYLVGEAIADVRFQVPARKLYDGMAKAVELLEAQPPTYRRILLVIGESQDEKSTAKLGVVVREAAEANISIYAVGLSSIGADLRGNGNGDAPLNLPGLPPMAAKPCVDFAGNPCFDFMSPAMWILERGADVIKNHHLEVAAAATGGIHYHGFHDNTIRDALDRIGAEIHGQYIISYAPSPDPRAGFNEIKVTVSRPNVTVRTRPGYFGSPIQ